MDSVELTLEIRRYAMSLGFMDCGFSAVRPLSEIESGYRQWIDHGRHASMEYMERNVEKRLNPALLVENAKTVISLLYNYYTPPYASASSLKISRYAYGTDYHFVVKDQLKKLDEFIRSKAEVSEQRYFVDSAPVMERAWAQESGLGWIGKNSCLVSRRFGSFFFIAEIITSLELDAGLPLKDFCGNCRKCIDACPTGAILDNRTLDSNRCISFQTIENRGEIPEGLTGKFSGYIFGCDICQEVCPWNTRSHQHREPLFYLRAGIESLTDTGWDNLNEDEFRQIFRNSAVKRTKFSGLKRNIAFVKASVQQPRETE